jgi:hypothetical protein
MPRLCGGMAVLVVAALYATIAPAQTVPDTFTATASVKKGSASATAPVRVTVTHYATAAERETVINAIKEGGTAGLRKALAGLSDAGFIQLADRRTPVKFASQRESAAGRLLTIVTAEPILFLGAGIPQSKPQTGFDVAVAVIELKEDGGGLGDLSPAAKVTVDEGGAVLIEDYGSTVIWLNAVAREVAR